MRFWDASAVVPLCLEEPTTPTITALAKDDEDLIVWWGTPLECISALARRRRDGVLSADAERQARDTLALLSAAWSEIQPTLPLRQRAERLLAIHPLRAADALQLAAALIWVQEATAGAGFVSLDHTLREAAAREGFSVLP